MRATGPGPLRMLIGSFLGLILLGTALLKLPAATPADRPIGWIDALFTATSATCVTGLAVRDTGTEFTLFGQLVIHFLDVHPPPFDALKVAWLFVPLVFLLLSFVYGVLKIPSLVNGIFTGRSGDSALPRALS